MADRRHGDHLGKLPGCATGQGKGLGGVGVAPVIGQAAINKESVLDAGYLAAFHALYVALLHAVDVAAHHHVQHIFLAFRDAGDRLDEAVSVVPVPAHQLLFGDVGQAQQHAVITHIPDNRVGHLLVSNVRQFLAFEQVSAE